VAAALMSAPAFAGDDGPRPVPHGNAAGAASGPLVALCPDIGESARVFTARSDGGLANTLERAGYRVYLVDPWQNAEADTGGFDAVVEDIYPALLGQLAEIAGEAPVTWVGHGLCGMLPVAAASADVPAAPAAPRWVALGTRLDYRFGAPAVRSWLASHARGEPPPYPVLRATLLTGLRDAPGFRSSTDPGFPQGVGAANAVRIVFEDQLMEDPPVAVVEDLIRWYEVGAPLARDGRTHYLDGLTACPGPVLLVAGCTDPIAPPEDVLAGLEPLANGNDVSYRLLSRVNRHREEYGHLGMLLSRHARRDVDRLVLRWLRGREQNP